MGHQLGWSLSSLRLLLLLRYVLSRRRLSNSILEKFPDIVVVQEGAHSTEAFPLLLGIEEEALVEARDNAEVVHDGAGPGVVGPHEPLLVLHLLQGELLLTLLLVDIFVPFLLRLVQDRAAVVDLVDCEALPKQVGLTRLKLELGQFLDGDWHVSLVDHGLVVLVLPLVKRVLWLHVLLLLVLIWLEFVHSNLVIKSCAEARIIRPPANLDKLTDNLQRHPEAA